MIYQQILENQQQQYCQQSGHQNSRLIYYCFTQDKKKLFQCEICCQENQKLASLKFNNQKFDIDKILDNKILDNWPPIYNKNLKKWVKEIQEQGSISASIEQVENDIFKNIEQYFSLKIKEITDILLKIKKQKQGQFSQQIKIWKNGNWPNNLQNIYDIENIKNDINKYFEGNIQLDQVYENQKKFIGKFKQEEDLYNIMYQFDQQKRQIYDSMQKLIDEFDNKFKDVKKKLQIFQNESVLKYRNKCEFLFYRSSFNQMQEEILMQKNSCKKITFLDRHYGYGGEFWKQVYSQILEKNMTYQIKAKIKSDGNHEKIGVVAGVGCHSDRDGDLYNQKYNYISIINCLSKPEGNNNFRFDGQYPIDFINNDRAKRLTGLDRPTIWTKFGALVAETQPVNLGQGFPQWNPPQFFLDALMEANKSQSQQYTRAFGTPSLTKSISDFYSPIFNRELDPNNNIVVCNGGVAVLNSIFSSMINPGEEVILLDPSYDCYAAQIQIAGGVVKSVPMKPKHLQSKQELLNKKNRYEIGENDLWEIDFDLLKKTFNEKTRAIVINSPHNPTGKIFSEEEYKKIAEIVKQNDICIVIEDQVYEHLTFETCEPFQNPRMAKVDGMWERTVNVSSAGKLFSATGIRVGWAIGPNSIIKCMQGFHQYNVFCMHGPTQEAVAISLQQSKTNGYFQDLNQKMMGLRNLFIDQLIEGYQDFNIWIPQGGYFILCDISKIQVPEKYYTNPLFSDYDISKDLAFSFYQANETKVLPIPCSIFYQKEHKEEGQNFVRYAICKEKETLLEAGQKLKKQLQQQ
ncbi:Pyridoxal phosphate-dependent transferase [Pseudocohnilembus persalinus]|uniref:Pyridoxal phosphate-dependent transferase n=1 Tax=Pseudocohnilembus persalinus TaxID=266149 RepID=A0A0V0Q8S1_PSEPJ|nr:Pyridoxal phosphate-dependent transferase [Pseudocohnilembus persalinus]|eukprot:KRW98636.1 Pyridoxal phosphate-dependent transferase [Pseudocohnilembus persalinus]